MTITAALPGTLPSRTQTPEEFVPAMDAFIAALPELASQMDIATSAMNFNSTTDTSSTSNTIDTTGNKTFTVSLNKSFYPSMFLVIGDAAAPTTNWIVGQVVSYTSTTLIITPIAAYGSGTKTAWVISQTGSPPVLARGASILHLTTGNDHGSTNTKVRIFTTTVTDTGTAAGSWTYTTSATAGAKITILASGVYSVIYKDKCSAATAFGISKNSTQLTTNFVSITESTKWAAASLTASINNAQCQRVGYLAAGDFIIPHTDNDAGFVDADADATKLIIERLW